MNRMTTSAILACAVLGGVPAFAAESADPAASSGPRFDLGGLMFGDLYTVPEHHLSGAEGSFTGLVMRRAYFTLNAEYGNWFGRLRLETNQDGEFESYGFDTDWKDVYIGYKLGKHKLMAGLQPTTNFDSFEKIWGARYLARTPLDLQGKASRDTGFGAAGPLDSDGKLGYRVLLSTPTSFAKDSSEDEHVMGALNWSPGNGWILELGADQTYRDGRSDFTLYQAWAGRQTDSLRWAVMYGNENRDSAAPLEMASAFVAAKVGGNRQFIARMDRLIEPSPKGNGIDYLPYDPSEPATTLFTGLEFTLDEHVKFTPNLVYTRYDDPDIGPAPESDLHLRLTLFLNFE